MERTLQEAAALARKGIPPFLEAKLANAFGTLGIEARTHPIWTHIGMAKYYEFTPIAKFKSNGEAKAHPAPRLEAGGLSLRGQVQALVQSLTTALSKASASSGGENDLESTLLAQLAAVDFPNEHEELWRAMVTAAHGTPDTNFVIL